MRFWKAIAIVGFLVSISPPDDDSILTTDLDAWQRVQDVNLKSVYLCCRAVLPIMQRQGKGSIINTASFVAVMGSATSQISYTASKGGVLALSRDSFTNRWKRSLSDSAWLNGRSRSSPRNLGTRGMNTRRSASGGASTRSWRSPIPSSKGL